RCSEPRSDDRRGFRRRQDLDGGEARIAEQDRPHRVAVDRPSGREVVLHEEASGRDELDQRLPCVGLAQAAVGEDELERRQRRQELAPVPDQQPGVPEARQALTRDLGAFRVDLHGHELARGLGHRRGPLPERGADLRDPPPGSQHAQQPLHGRDRRPAVRHFRSSARGNERCTRGGTRKFWRWVVVSTELKPCPRSFGSNGSLTPSGSTPSIARRLRWKSSLVGLKTTKWSPAAGWSLIWSTSGCALKKNGLSSVLKSARCGI